MSIGENIYNRYGRTGIASAEGATAPETLRQKDRDGGTKTLERGVDAPAEGITISGAKDRGGIRQRIALS